MKIMHLISGSEADDIGRRVTALLQELSKQHEVTLVCLGEGELAHHARQREIRTRVIKGNPFSLRKKLLTGLTCNGYDLLHCHGRRADTYGSWLRGALEIPVISTIYADPWEGSLLDRYAVCHRDGLVTVSGSMKQALVARAVSADRIWPIYDGVDFPRKIKCVPRQEYLKSMGLAWTMDNVIFGADGELAREQDLSALIRVFGKILQQVPGARLLIAGEPELQMRLEALAAESCPAGTVCFSGSMTDAESFYHCVDVNICCANHADLRPVLEGARMYCPAIAMAAGNPPEPVTEGETGFLVNADDWETMEKCMVQLARERDLRHRLGGAMYRKAQAEFSIEQMAKRQIAAYEQILSE